MKGLADSHAPEREHIITVRPHLPWYTPDIDDAKKHRRKLEKQWKQSKLQVHYDMLKTQRNQVTLLISQSKREYLTNAITNANDQKELFRIAKAFMFKHKVRKLPSSSSDLDLANRFSRYFDDKVANIRDNIEAELEQNNYNIPDYHPDTTTVFSDLPCATEKDVREFIMKSPTKSCGLDPIPTWLLKESLDVLLPAITAIVNKSIQTGVMPENLKQACVSPVLKKSDLDKESLKNYRPISNLPFISKIIEKHVLKHLNRHVDENNLYERYQSAYTKCHSTETALVRIQNDLLTAVDTKGAAILVLLDLSAAFDTVDHNTLLHRLQKKFGITGTALSWVQSYLANRAQYVAVNAAHSTAKTLRFGMPQGSNFGPDNFKKYSVPLGDIARLFGLGFHCYADDTQLFLAFNPKDNMEIKATVHRVQQCVQAIHEWMTANYLKLNEDKTEILVIHKSDQPPLRTVRIGETDIGVGSSAKNLGVILDTKLKLDKHINSTCRKAFAEIRNIGRMRKFLDTESAMKLVHAFVTSKVDYCNALLYGLPMTELSKLQRVLNTAARLVTCKRIYDHITPVLKSLHWLPITERIDFKIILLTFKALHGTAPLYLTELLHNYQPSRHLRSSHEHLFVTPRHKLKQYGYRAFSTCAPSLWNSLPSHLRSIDNLNTFKTSLKTYLFKRAFNV